MTSLSRRSLLSLLFLPFLSAALAQNPTPQSISGDWGYSVNGVVALILHLNVDPSGHLTGAIDAPSPSTTHFALTNISLSGNILKFNMATVGPMTDVVAPDGKSILGMYQWHRMDTAGITALQAAGDFQSTDPPAIAITLHLRLDPSGSLTGTIDTAFPSQRLKITDIHIVGNRITLKTSTGGTITGIFSSDHNQIVGVPAWNRTRTLAQALAADAQVKLLPTDGTWAGSIYRTQWGGLGTPANNTLPITLHFTSDPLSCTFQSPQQGTNGDVPCTMTLTGNHVHFVGSRITATTFDGTLSPDGQHLTGTWTIGPPHNWGALPLTLTHTAPAPLVK